MGNTLVGLGTQLRVPKIGYGAMSLAGAYGGIDDASALELLNALIGEGVTFIDTANVYGDGRSEELVGRFLKAHRDEVTVATKVGIVAGGGVGQRGIRGDREYIHEQVEHSLRRLGTDRIDLYYQHRIDPDVPIEETVGALAELVQAGKVLNIGLSEATGEELRRAHAVHPIAAVQSEWSVLSRDVEAHVVPVAAELGIGFVSYASVGRGLFGTGFDPAALAAGDGRHRFPRFFPENLQANIELAKEVAEVAGRHGVSTEEVALAWLFAKGEEFGVQLNTIPGTRTLAHLRSNLRSLELVLTPADIARLDTLADRVRGARSPAPHQVSGGREGLIETEAVPA
ncbi:aldo/keto reductase [Arthrobacter ginkgonis]|uniref:Aldo/keto reductase n=1 Tax=Arthrobacter ginkgonis TaxID=1630594 RepID=A0ABP7C3B2_9MICC